MDHVPHDRRRPETIWQRLTYEAYLAQPTLRVWIEEEARRARNAAMRDAIAAPFIRLFRRRRRALARAI